MIKCKNKNCKHHGKNNSCTLKKATIGLNAKCENFEKGFSYYFYYFTTMRSNFILKQELDADMRYCIYYLMKCLPIEFAVDDIRGILVLKEIDGDKYLTADDIFNMIQSDKLNEVALEECILDFIENGLPIPNKEEKEKPKVEEQPFGWLSPNGDFIEGDWGEHEEIAEQIIEKKGWDDEYWEWHNNEPTDYVNLCRDFLSKVKGYALIHDPSNLGYIVTYIKPLTKKQKDFLYGYFIDMGDRLRAEKYLNESN